MNEKTWAELPEVSEAMVNKISRIRNVSPSKAREQLERQRNEVLAARRSVQEEGDS
jgi:hypothetical protein